MNWNGEERRRFVRAKFSCNITLSYPQKHTISTQTENISAGGLRVILEERIKPSSVVKVSLQGIGKKTINCTGKVKWVFSRENPGGQSDFIYDTGIEFCQIKKQDEALIKKLVVSIISGDEPKSS